MCGRFTQKLSSAELARIFEARDAAGLAGDRYNVAPTQSIAAVVEEAGERVVERFRWGLVPAWATSPAGGGRLINARAETVATSAAYRHSFRAKRCLIPAGGFYEWRRTPGSSQPFYVARQDGAPLAFAGLWSAWHDPATDRPLLTCSIVTTTPNALMATIHDRMPVILAPGDWPLWLDRATEPAELQALLRPSDAALVAWPVARLVNSVRNQGPTLVVPLPG